MSFQPAIPSTIAHMQSYLQTNNHKCFFLHRERYIGLFFFLLLSCFLYSSIRAIVMLSYSCFLYASFSTGFTTLQQCECSWCKCHNLYEVFIIFINSLFFWTVLATYCSVNGQWFFYLFNLLSIKLNSFSIFLNKEVPVKLYVLNFKSFQVLGTCCIILYSPLRIFILVSFLL